jgi:UDP-3-O-[3-hydroxymyristoyl] N-acetylglucosamine deacetylase/3-hydroxyacyl-[acyl-carrier-protein] dehydratase
MRPQRTIAREATLHGVGIHTGEAGAVTFKPAPEHHGIVFVRTDLPGRPTVAVRPENAVYDPHAGRRTILAQNGVQIHTMEHVLASISGLGIDNVLVETTTMEIVEPEDGSALAFATLLKDSGVVEQAAGRRHLKIFKPVTLRQGDIELTAVPSDRFRITFTIDYDHPAVGAQTFTFEGGEAAFIKDIAPARTFVLQRDVDALQAQGLIRGGTLNNAVVIGDKGVVNDGGLRFPNEFVRHKVLDLMGDLTLLGAPLLGHVIAFRSGHATHVEFVKKIAREMPRSGRRDDRPAWEWDISDIMGIMPHRYPFLLIDRILEFEEGKRVVGLKNVTINEPFFEGHFPGHPVMPGVLIIEAMAQCGGVLLLNMVDDPTGKLVYFIGIDDAKFRRPVRPGDTLRFELTLEKLKGRICRMKGLAFVDGQLAAEAVLTSSIVDA